MATLVKECIIVIALPKALLSSLLLYNDDLLFKVALPVVEKLNDAVFEQCLERPHQQVLSELALAVQPQVHL